MIIEPNFWKYIVVDAEGVMIGIREDAPAEAKKEYEEFITESNKLREEGIKIYCLKNYYRNISIYSKSLFL